MDKINMLIELLKIKEMITPLEQDILDTWHELNKEPFTINSAKRQVDTNDTNHQDIFLKIAFLPTTVPKPRHAITEDDIRYNLSNQLALLVEKEVEALNREQ